MPDQVSRLNEPQLRQIFSRIKELANSAEVDALAEIDEFLLEVQELFLYADSSDVDCESSPKSSLQRVMYDYKMKEVQDFGEELDSFRTRIDQNSSIRLWQCQSLARRAQELGKSRLQNLGEGSDEIAKEIRRLRTEATPLVRRGEFLAHSQAVNRLSGAPIHSLTTAKIIVKELDDAATFFEKHALYTNELKQSLRKGKVRVAWHRAKKKLPEAEVAEAGGKSTRAAKLKKEAAALLTQDWGFAFPDESPPDAVI